MKQIGHLLLVLVTALGIMPNCAVPGSITTTASDPTSPLPKLEGEVYVIKQSNLLDTIGSKGLRIVELFGGEVVVILENDDDNYYLVQHHNRAGYFPRKYLSKTYQYTSGPPVAKWYDPNGPPPLLGTPFSAGYRTYSKGRSSATDSPASHLQSSPPRSAPSSSSGCSSTQCSGTTKKGNRCQNRTTNCSGRCYLH